MVSEKISFFIDHLPPFNKYRSHFKFREIYSFLLLFCFVLYLPSDVTHWNMKKKEKKKDFCSLLFSTNCPSDMYYFQKLWESIHHFYIVLLCLIRIDSE